MSNKIAVNKISQYLMGELVMVWAANFNYWGRLIDCDEGGLVLEDAWMVFEVGNLTEPIKNKEKLPNSVVVLPVSAIEAVSRYDK